MRHVRLVVLLIFFASLPIVAKSQVVSVPFTNDNPNGLVIVPAQLGNIPVHLFFDTGAGLDIFAPSLIEKLHGKPAGRFTGFRATGERLDLPLFIIPKLSVGPLVKKDALVASWDVLDKYHMDGGISLNDFRQQPITFDFVKKQLIFETRKSVAQRRAHGESSPLQLDDYRGIALDMFSQFLIGDQPGQCEIDTGSPSATVSTRYMVALGIEKDGKGVQKRERPTVAGGTQVRWDTTLPRISLASAPDVYLANAPVSFSDIIYDCMVGVDFWRGRQLTIDIADRQLIVSK